MIESLWNGDMCTLRLSRADKANALSKDMLEALLDGVQAARDAKALVLTGAGRVFSAGMDLEAAQSDLPTSPVWEDLSRAISEHPGLTIAALNGTAAGGSLGMVLACDLRIAAPHTKIFYPVMRLGFLPQPSDPVRLTQLVGPARAKHVLMAGQKVEATQALSWGLINEVVESEGLMPRAAELAEAALSAEFSHITAIKGLFPN